MESIGAKLHLSRFCIVAIAIACIFSLASLTESRTLSKEFSNGKLWCIANPDAKREYLQRVTSVLCNVVNCSSIQPGGSCYDPNTVVGHASVVFNLYFQPRSGNPRTCNFGGDAMLTSTDPSHGTCIFPSS